MNKNHVEGRATQAKGKVKENAGKVTGDKRAEFKGKAEKTAGKSRAVLADVNDNPRKKSK